MNRSMMGNTEAYSHVTQFLRNYPNAMPPRLSNRQQHELVNALVKLYTHGFDRGYRVGQEDLAASTLT